MKVRRIAAVLATCLFAALLTPEVAVAAPDVRVASYNVKGWHLTEGAGQIDGRVRMRESLTRIEAKQLGIVGLQELESPQAEVIRNDGGWELFRADPNTQLAGSNYTGNAIMWKDQAWNKVAAWQLHATVGNRRTLHLPIVLLQHTLNGERVVVMSVHNPAGPENAEWREAMRRIEREKIRDLKQHYQHVLLVGDMNENEAAACFFTTNGLMKAATGYHPNPNGSCPTAGYPGVDWIFGAGDIGFAGWEVDRTFEERRWSDHPLVSAYYTYR
ncbi:Endonuclease/exonuclease/phosphatase [Kribbella flavida DSM 17836]|uniref:Endonuclease/exonuclease/phosphatase n=1 Tax=Kribbella flavida (strain DSM 17836 / JCM 10339 / NBRC 14399) TaxID=479435 RepID=D2PRQ0_KRIFD|nr:endonuclease/exonuclease/phosphatase family protein [Kribbella flavida]ADB34968.1 Endonuclease/exonuclease/phosphatase [Kribbella flavida DSM 17836]